MAASRERLRQRAAIARAVRDYFDAQGFLEVETPARVANPGQELHLDAFPAGAGRDGGARYLITSPEHHMKRLLARLCRGTVASPVRIYQMCRAFRAGEAGPHHLGEFTMLEWYRAGEPLSMIARDCEAILQAAVRAIGAPTPAPARRTTVRALLREHAGFDLRGDEAPGELRDRLRAAGHPAPDDAAWDDLFFQVFLDRVEPALSGERAVIVEDWPLPLAALARRKAEDPSVAERFELYGDGLELANAYGELTDASEQRARFAAELARRRALGKQVYPIDEALLAALPALPAPTSGVALGFDRLVMWATGAREIREVVAFAE